MCDLDSYLFEEVDPDLRNAGPDVLKATRLMIMRMQPALNVWYMVESTVAEAKRA